MSTDVVLETRELSMQFGGVVAVDKVNFLLREHELRCLIGPNGAGKSTFFKCLTGQLTPTAGSVRVNDQDITGYQPHAIAQLGIGIKTQVPSVFEALSVYENIWLAARQKRSSSHAKTPSSKTRSQVLLERLDLVDLAAQPVNQLAHGQRQWVELAMVLAAEPWLILLDEPTAGLSQEEMRRTAAIIRDINQTATLIVVDHDIPFIQRIAETVTVFHQGTLLLEADIDTVLQDQRVRDVYLGKTAAAGG